MRSHLSYFVKASLSQDNIVGITYDLILCTKFWKLQRGIDYFLHKTQCSEDDHFIIFEKMKIKTRKTRETSTMPQ